jgi:thioesterase domain-containing protein/acyl carrier protein
MDGCWNWQGDNLDTDVLRSILSQNGGEHLMVEGIPNARLAEEVRLARLLGDFESMDTVGQLRRVLAELPTDLNTRSPDLEELERIAAQANYKMEVSWVHQDRDGGSYDLFFSSSSDGIVARSQHRKSSRLSNDRGPADEHFCPTTNYTNNPLSARIRRDLSSQLRSFVQTNLPDYMVPSAFVTLDALPVTPNGKLDRKALPAPEYRIPESTLILPRDAIETRLATIWQEVLGVHPVGVTDNFFELGGDSLLGTHLFLRVEEEFAKHLPLGTLFEAPTIEKLAAILRQESWVSSSLIQVQAGHSSVPPMFFVEARVGYRTLAAELGPNQPLYVVTYDDLFVSNTDRSLSDLAAELAQRIRDHHPHGPYYLGGMCLAGYVAFAIARELCQQGKEVAFLAIIDMPVPEYARLSRVAALRHFVGRLHWHVHRALQGHGQQKIARIAESFGGVSWHARHRAWQLARLFFRLIGRPLPQSLRHPGRLMAQAVGKDVTTSYPGHITLFRPRERIPTGYDQWDLGWGQIAAHGVDVYEIAGEHRALLRENATEVGRRLKECLGRAQQPHAAETRRPRHLEIQLTPPVHGLPPVVRSNHSLPRGGIDSASAQWGGDRAKCK